MYLTSQYTKRYAFIQPLSLAVAGGSATAGSGAGIAPVKSVGHEFSVHGKLSTCGAEMA